jgi:hypothetical protein
MPLASKEELAGRMYTGEPFGWERKTRYRWGGRAGDWIIRTQRLHGVAWTCP